MDQEPEPAQRAVAMGEPAWMHAKEPDLGVLVALVQRTMIERLNARLAAEFGELRPMHGFVFRTCFPDGATITAVARAAGVSKQAIVQVVDGLERRGLVTRAPHPTDRRQKLVRLTARGERALQAALSTFREIEAEWAERIGRERMAALRADLRAFLDARKASS